jgi:hypothetical protein
MKMIMMCSLINVFWFFLSFKLNEIIFLYRYDVDIKYVFPISHSDCAPKPARADFSPILVEVGSKIPRKPGITYKVALGH